MHYKYNVLAVSTNFTVVFSIWEILHNTQMITAKPNSGNATA